MSTITVRVAAAASSTARPIASTQPLLVYAASSLTSALDELGAAYLRATGRAVTFSYAASSLLARQLEAGARADVFFAADTDWMDYLQARKLIDNASRVNMLSNELVLIAPADSSTSLTITRGFGLRAALGNGRLSIGDPDSVPVGKYARAALESLGVWGDVEARVVRADNARSALAFVARGEAPLGIVYVSDALVERKVRVVAAFPAHTHAPIVYPIALTRTAAPLATDFVNWLRGSVAQATFRKYGFGPPQ